MAILRDKLEAFPEWQNVEGHPRHPADADPPVGWLCLLAVYTDVTSSFEHTANLRGGPETSPGSRNPSRI